MNLPPSVVEWKVLNDYFKAGLLPSVVQSIDVDSKFSVLSSGFHRSLIEAFGSNSHLSPIVNIKKDTVEGPC